VYKEQEKMGEKKGKSVAGMRKTGVNKGEEKRWESLDEENKEEKIKENEN
jgi:hypothetical protein